MKNDNIPRATIERLSIYLQELENFQREGVEVVSSEPLARACGVNASQIRKDLTYFGEFGVRGVGYNVPGLINSLSEALGIDQEWNCALVGLGNLGKALLGNRELTERRFHIAAVFDFDPFKLGQVVSGMEVQDSANMKEIISELNIRIGIITCPPERTQRAANQLVEAGVKGILSYSSTRINVPEGVRVEYMDFFHHLYSLAFNISGRSR